MKSSILEISVDVRNDTLSNTVNFNVQEGRGEDAALGNTQFLGILVRE